MKLKKADGSHIIVENELRVRHNVAQGFDVEGALPSLVVLDNLNEKVSILQREIQVLKNNEVKYQTYKYEKARYKEYNPIEASSMGALDKRNNIMAREVCGCTVICTEIIDGKKKSYSYYIKYCVDHTQAPDLNMRLKKAEKQNMTLRIKNNLPLYD